MNLDLRRFTDWQQRAERRLLTLERMARQALGSAVRYFTDLEDVPPWLEIEEPDIGDYTVWGVNWDDYDQPRWEPLTVMVDGSGGGGGSGAYASMSVAGTWNGSAVSGDRVEWDEATSGYELSYINSGSYPGIVRGIGVTVPGIYLVEASVKATMAGGSGELFVLAGMQNSAAGAWQIGAGDTNDCRPGIIVSDTGTDGASVSKLMPLGDGTSVYIDVDLGGGMTECEWRLQAALIHEADTQTGACAS